MRCNGWWEHAHETAGPLASFERADDTEVHLCPCCVIDFLNDPEVPEAEKLVARDARDAARQD